MTPEHVKDLLDDAQGVRGALEWYDDADMLAETIRDSYHVASDTPLEDANLIIAIPEIAQGYIDQAEQIERLQAALRKADKWGDILSDLYEDEFITEEDMQ